MTFYLSFAMQVEGELRDSLIFFERILNLENNQADYLENLDLSDIDIRITLINPDGKVLYDNVITDESQLENHSAREEIKQASENGIGEEKRLSETIGEETYYYAVKLSDFNILRVSKTTSSVYGVFASVLPQSLLITSVILIACLIIARRLTKNIVDPINNFNFDENTKIYDELSPFVRTITNQKEQIERGTYFNKQRRNRDFGEQKRDVYIKYKFKPHSKKYFGNNPKYKCFGAYEKNSFGRKQQYIFKFGRKSLSFVFQFCG